MKENERKRERWSGTKKDKTKNGRCWGHPVAHTNLWIEVILENLGTIRAGSSRRSSRSTVIHWWRTVNNLARLSSLSIRAWPFGSHGRVPRRLSRERDPLVGFLARRGLFVLHSQIQFQSTAYPARSSHWLQRPLCPSISLLGSCVENLQIYHFGINVSAWNRSFG